jgi:hypothetical protein
LPAGSHEQLAALTAGYQAAFLAGACFAALGALLGAVLLRTSISVAKAEAAASTDAFKAFRS